MTWSVYDKILTDGVEEMGDEQARLTINNIRRMPVTCEVLLDIDNVVLIWRWKMNASYVIVYLRQAS